MPYLMVEVRILSIYTLSMGLISQPTHAIDSRKMQQRVAASHGLSRVA